MTVTPATINSNTVLPDSSIPPRPPSPERDDLDGYLDVYLAQSVKPHRERLADIISVIDGTFTGAALLDHFRDRARQNNALVVNLLAAGAPLPEGAAAQGLWLNEADLTATAQQIGVAPEVQSAPSVFQSLVLARNASLAQPYIENAGQQNTEQAGKDAAELLTRFQQELAARHARVPERAARADTAQALHQARLAAAAIAQKANQLRLVPADPKSGGVNADSPIGDSIPAAGQDNTPATGQSSARHATVSAVPSGEPATMDDRKDFPRRGSAPSSLTGSDGGAGAHKPSTGSMQGTHGSVPNVAAPSGTLPMASITAASDTDLNAAQNNNDGTPAAKPKKARRNLTQWVNKRFQGFVDRINAVRRARGPAEQASEPQHTVTPAGSTHSSPAASRSNMAGQNPL